ncbi:MAG: hypothetical protein K0Q76_3412 [Panacagrimonas sp.]|jgi:hypothetical protein|nr:hypothetical protein [Panacagrimonas sp.]MCC2658304.1 hypothetical protein [Panacagrimonas sp.]
MKRIILHIGSPKTGTTTIQRSLFRSREQPHGFTYPDLNTGQNKLTAHHHLLLLLKAHDELPRRMRYLFTGSRYSRTVEDTKAKLREELQNADNIVLSSEYLFSMRDRHIAALKDILTECGVDEILICLYVREPAAYYASIVQEACKGTGPFPQPDSFRYPIKDVIERWSAHFDGQVAVRGFHRDLLANGDVFTDFVTFSSQHFGVTKPAIEPLSENQSISIEALMLLDRYRARFHPTQASTVTRDIDVLVGHLQKLGAASYTKVALKPNVSDLIYANHEPALTWLKDRFGIDFTRSQVRAPDPLKTPLDMEDIFVTSTQSEPSSLVLDLVHRLVAEARG